MKIVVDGVAFQAVGVSLDARQIVAVWWTGFLNAFASHGDFDLRLLDRGDAPSAVGWQTLPYPPQTKVNDARDSILLQKMCDHLDADIFVSTGFTTPLRTPAIAIVDTPQPPGLEERDDERALAMAFARGVCSAMPSSGHSQGRGRVASARPEAGAQEPPAPTVTTGVAPASPSFATHDELVGRFHTIAGRVVERARNGHYARFFTEWDRLRRLQADVDVR